MDSKNTEQDATTTKKRTDKEGKENPFWFALHNWQTCISQRKKEGGKIKKKKKKASHKERGQVSQIKTKAGERKCIHALCSTLKLKLKKDLKKYLSLHTPVLSSH